MPLPSLVRGLLLPLLLGSGACGDPTVSGGGEQRELEWHQVTWAGVTTDVGLVRPDDGTPGPHPVIVALPWGAGTPDLVYSFLDAYWAVEPPRRGYAVVSPSITGSSLAEVGAAFVPALLEWIESTLDADPGRIVLVGASNGGRGIFHAGLVAPDRFAAMMGLPGAWTGPGEGLAPLADKPIRLLVGAFDTGWLESTAATAAALAGHGNDVRVDTVPGQGHVMNLDPVDLMTWIDQAVGRVP